jgi:hypothetical protein
LQVVDEAELAHQRKSRMLDAHRARSQQLERLGIDFDKELLCAVSVRESPSCDQCSG